MSTALVWVDGWQLQCCGEMFRIGDEVRWVAASDPDRRWLAETLGAGLAEQVEFREEHHQVEELGDRAVRLHGRVARIRAATDDANGSRWPPAPGTREINDVDTAYDDLPGDGSEGRPQEIGLIVDLDLFAPPTPL